MYITVSTNAVERRGQTNLNESLGFDFVSRSVQEIKKAEERTQANRATGD